MSYVLGVTGGIASGKSTVIEVFKTAGFPIVDGDIVARQVVEPGTPGLAALIKVFGREIITSEGTLNRKKLGNLIFQNTRERQRLDRTLGPFIREEINRQIAAGKRHSPLVVADIPLLYEGNYEKEVDAVAVVYTDCETQLRRLMKRNNLTEVEAANRINSQMSLEEKKQRADIVFDNCGSINETTDQVNQWLKKQGFDG